MITSKFINHILDLLLDGDELGKAVRLQIKFLSEKEYNYTGVGVFVSFSHSPGIEAFRLTTAKATINGVQIESESLGVGAEAMVIIEDGLIDYVEIWSYDGVYPTEELKSYTMRQTWTGSPERVVTEE